MAVVAGSRQESAMEARGAERGGCFSPPPPWIQVPSACPSGRPFVFGLNAYWQVRIMASLQSPFIVEYALRLAVHVSRNGVAATDCGSALQRERQSERPVGSGRLGTDISHTHSHTRARDTHNTQHAHSHSHTHSHTHAHTRTHDVYRASQDSRRLGESAERSPCLATSALAWAKCDEFRYEDCFVCENHLNIVMEYAARASSPHCAAPAPRGGIVRRVLPRAPHPLQSRYPVLPARLWRTRARHSATVSLAQWLGVRVSHRRRSGEQNQRVPRCGALQCTRLSHTIRRTRVIRRATSTCHTPHSGARLWRMRSSECGGPSSLALRHEHRL